MKPIFILVYTSRATVEADNVLLTELMKVSKQNNTRDDITGFLVARTGYFLQLIEGEETKVRALFQKISKDRRHSRIVLQGESYTETRIAPDWDMGLVPNDRRLEEAETILGLLELGRRGEIYSDPESLMAILRVFAKNAKPIGAPQPT